jgi:hypothetical protein
MTVYFYTEDLFQGRRRFVHVVGIFYSSEHLTKILWNKIKKIILFTNSYKIVEFYNSSFEFFNSPATALLSALLRAGGLPFELKSFPIPAKGRRVKIAKVDTALKKWELIGLIKG